jgi:membrane protein required for beta-lactamase induction
MYLTLGWGNQPKEWRNLSLGPPGRPTLALFLIIGIILIFTKNILFGIGVIILGLLIGVYWGGKRKEYLLNSSAINSASQKVGSHKLMKIIADEMSKGSAMEQVVEALKREIMK